MLDIVDNDVQREAIELPGVEGFFFEDPEQDGDKVLVFSGEQRQGRIALHYKWIVLVVFRHDSPVDGSNVGLFIQLVEQQFKGSVGLGAEGDLGAESIEHALADFGLECCYAVTEIGLAPGPAAAQGFVGIEPCDGPDAAGRSRFRADVKDRALVEIDIGNRPHAPCGLDG